MNKSILHFNEIGIKKIEKGLKNFMEHPDVLDSFADTVLSVLLSFGLDILKESIEDADRIIRESPELKHKWNINRREKTQLLCRLGNLVYERTLFQNKKDGTYRYLLDDIMEPEGHERMTSGAEAALLTEAIDSRYRKGGEQVSLTDFVSKQTVKNKLHGLTIKERMPEATEKKQVEVLYIDADEDHISEQILEKGEDGKQHLVRGNGTIIGKLIYLYEGIEPENVRSRRNRLVRKHYFGGVYEGKANAKLWEEVTEYIEAVYDTEFLKKVYISGDGAEWIKARKEFIRIKNPEIIGCSAEGHVSHLYASRMSSRPMGWGRHGAEQMCRLRCYRENGGDILELVKRQRSIRREREETPRKEPLGLFGAEFSKTQKNNDYYIEKCQARLGGLTAKKQLWFWSHKLEF